MTNASANTDNNLVSFLRRAADKAGFVRQSYVEQNIPTTPLNVYVVPFFGDMASTFLFSSLVLKKWKELHKRRYLIICSWPGQRALFPYADEYWSIQDQASLVNLANHAHEFDNHSDVYTSYVRQLNQHFENVLSFDHFRNFYYHGFGQDYWNNSPSGEIQYFLPEIPSATMLGESFKYEIAKKSGQKVVLHPSRRLRTWQRGKLQYVRVPVEFWTALGERLLAENFVPVFYQNVFSYDMSPHFTDRCIYLVAQEAANVLSAMKAIGCVLDIHSGFSRWAIAARCPYLAVDERLRYFETKDYEIEDLIAGNLPRQYIFSFSTMLLTGTVEEWSNSLIDNVVVKLRHLFEAEKPSDLNTHETYATALYDGVRRRKLNRLGVRFIRKY